MTGVIIRRKDTESQKEKVHVKTEAEIREMLQQVKGLQRLLATHQKLGERHRTDSSSESPEEQLCRHPDFRFRAS